MREKENKCHLRLVNCLSRTLQQHKIRRVLGTRQEHHDNTVRGCHRRNMHIASKTSQSNMRSVVTGAGSGGFRAFEEASDPVRLPCKLPVHIFNLFPRLWFAAFKHTFVSEGNLNGAFCWVKRSYKPLILPLWCMHLWKEVMCTAAARTWLCVCALDRANECGANGTEVIMWSVIALWFLLHLWAAFCHF